MKAVTSFDRDVDDKWHGELKRPALQRWGRWTPFEYRPMRYGVRRNFYAA